MNSGGQLLESARAIQAFIPFLICTRHIPNPDDLKCHSLEVIHKIHGKLVDSMLAEVLEGVSSGVGEDEEKHALFPWALPLFVQRKTMTAKLKDAMAKFVHQSGEVQEPTTGEVAWAILTWDNSGDAFDRTAYATSGARAPFAGIAFVGARAGGGCRRRAASGRRQA